MWAFDDKTQCIQAVEDTDLKNTKPYQMIKFSKEEIKYWTKKENAENHRKETLKYNKTPRT